MMLCSSRTVILFAAITMALLSHDGVAATPASARDSPTVASLPCHPNITTLTINESGSYAYDCSLNATTGLAAYHIVINCSDSTLVGDASFDVALELFTSFLSISFESGSVEITNTSLQLVFSGTSLSAATMLGLYNQTDLVNLSSNKSIVTVQDAVRLLVVFNMTSVFIPPLLAPLHPSVVSLVAVVCSTAVISCNVESLTVLFSEYSSTSLPTTSTYLVRVASDVSIGTATVVNNAATLVLGRVSGSDVPPLMPNATSSGVVRLDGSVGAVNWAVDRGNVELVPFCPLGSSGCGGYPTVCGILLSNGSIPASVVIALTDNAMVSVSSGAMLWADDIQSGVVETSKVVNVSVVSATISVTSGLAAVALALGSSVQLGEGGKSNVAVYVTLGDTSYVFIGRNSSMVSVIQTPTVEGSSTLASFVAIVEVANGRQMQLYLGGAIIRGNFTFSEAPVVPLVQVFVSSSSLVLEAYSTLVALVAVWRNSTAAAGGLAATSNIVDVRQVSVKIVNGSSLSLMSTSSLVVFMSPDSLLGLPTALVNDAAGVFNTSAVEILLSASAAGSTISDGGRLMRLPLPVGNMDVRLRDVAGMTFEGLWSAIVQVEMVSLYSAPNLRNPNGGLILFQALSVSMELDNCFVDVTNSAALVLLAADNAPRAPSVSSPSISVNWTVINSTMLFEGAGTAGVLMAPIFRNLSSACSDDNTNIMHPILQSVGLRMLDAALLLVLANASWVSVPMQLQSPSNSLNCSGVTLSGGIPHVMLVVEGSQVQLVGASVLVRIDHFLTAASAGSPPPLVLVSVSSGAQVNVSQSSFVCSFGNGWFAVPLAVLSISLSVNSSSGCFLSQTATAVAVLAQQMEVSQLVVVVDGGSQVLAASMCSVFLLQMQSAPPLPSHVGSMSVAVGAYSKVAISLQSSFLELTDAGTAYPNASSALLGTVSDIAVSVNGAASSLAVMYESVFVVIYKRVGIVGGAVNVTCHGGEISLSDEGFLLYAPMVSDAGLLVSLQSGCSVGLSGSSAVVDFYDPVAGMQNMTSIVIEVTSGSSIALLTSSILVSSYLTLAVARSTAAVVMLSDPASVALLSVRSAMLRVGQIAGRVKVFVQAGASSLLQDESTLVQVLNLQAAAAASLLTCNVTVSGSQTALEVYTGSAAVSYVSPTSSSAATALSATIANSAVVLIGVDSSLLNVTYAVDVRAGALPSGVVVSLAATVAFGASVALKNVSSQLLVFAISSISSNVSTTMMRVSLIVSISDAATMFVWGRCVRVVRIPMRSAVSAPLLIMPVAVSVSVSVLRSAVVHMSLPHMWEPEGGGFVVIFLAADGIVALGTDPVLVLAQNLTIAVVANSSTISFMSPPSVNESAVPPAWLVRLLFGNNLTTRGNSSSAISLQFVPSVTFAGSTAIAAEVSPVCPAPFSVLYQAYDPSSPSMVVRMTPNVTFVGCSTVLHTQLLRERLSAASLSAANSNTTNVAIVVTQVDPMVCPSVLTSSATLTFSSSRRTKSRSFSASMGMPSRTASATNSVSPAASVTSTPTYSASSSNVITTSISLTWSKSRSVNTSETVSQSIRSPSSTHTSICHVAFDNQTLCDSEPQQCQWCETLRYCTYVGEQCTEDCHLLDPSNHPQCSGACALCSSPSSAVPYCSASCDCYALDPTVRDECDENVGAYTKGSCVYCAIYGYCSPANAAQCSCSVIENATLCRVIYGGSCSYDAANGGCTDGPCFSFLIRGFTAQPYFLFLIALIKDVMSLMLVNAIGPLAARWLGKAKRLVPWAPYRHLPLTEFALEDTTAYYVESPRSFRSAGGEDGTITERYSSGIDSDLLEDSTVMSAVLREAPRHQSVLVSLIAENDACDYGSDPEGQSPSAKKTGGSPLLKRKKSRKLHVSLNSGDITTASGASYFPPRVAAHREADEDAVLHSDSATTFTDSADHEHRSHRGCSTRTSRVASLIPSAPEVSRMTREQYCREILLPLLFVTDDVDGDELVRQSQRLLALMIAEDVWIDVFQLPTDQDPPRHDLESMPMVVNFFATQHIVVYTSMTVKGRIGHTLDTYVSPAVLWILITSESVAWSIYISEVVLNYSQQLSRAEMFQLVCFRVVNSGAVTSLSLLVVKYVVSWQLSLRPADGSLPPVAAATRARFLFTRRVHVLTALFVLLEMPMLMVGIAGMALYPILPTVMCILAVISRRFLAPLTDRTVRRVFHKFNRKREASLEEKLKLVRVLIRFVLEQQLPALALALSLQASANYLLLFSHKDLYQLSYFSVMEKEYLSRSASCFEQQLREDLAMFVKRSAGVIQWMTALFPGA